MAISRHDQPEYISLRDAINRLFEGSFVTPFTLGTRAGALVPAADVYETADNYVIHLTVPGATPDHINIAVQGNTITISGEIVKHWEDQQRGQVYLQEIESGRFTRSFTLPSDVDTQQAEASYENGILTLTLPKAEAAKPRRIHVKTGQTIEGS
jgi:HSP20 family protein